MIAILDEQIAKCVEDREVKLIKLGQLEREVSLLKSQALELEKAISDLQRIKGMVSV